MNKGELVERVAKNTKYPKTVTENILNGVVDTIVKTVKKGEEVRLVDFGTFCVGRRKERKGVNPRTRQEMLIPAKKTPKFRAGLHFKTQVK